LYEELHTLTEGTLATDHAKIKAFQGATIPWGTMEQELRRLRKTCAARDSRQLVLALRGLVADYNPSTDLLQRVLSPPAEFKSMAAGAR
jgi:FlaA1/EpsC-like NDP-sugar epimerase